MTPLVLIRHGPTDWNADGRLQGRTDRPLSDAGRAAVCSWRLPPGLGDYHWITSPLSRARQTAELLGHGDAEIEVAIIEAHWGAWEGWRLADLRVKHGAAMTALEVRGLDLRPPGGERPRDVQIRVRPWLRRVAEAGRPTVAVCHNGVIRAIYGLASGWDLTGRPPEKLRDGRAHRITIDAEGRPVIDRLNIPLAP